MLFAINNFKIFEPDPTSVAYDETVHVVLLDKYLQENPVIFNWLI